MFCRGARKRASAALLLASKSFIQAHPVNVTLVERIAGKTSWRDMLHSADRMVRTTKAADAGSRRSRQDGDNRDHMTSESDDAGAARLDKTTAGNGVRPATAGAEICAGAELGLDPSCGSAEAAPVPDKLSVRAENVLKGLAEELTGESPPQRGWIPSDRLLQTLTFRHLSTARNCGPQTTAEIINWARARGKVIRPAVRTGKSLSAMWQEAIARFSAGEISKAEVAEALENSARRRNTRIPVAFQRMLVELVKSSNE
jgi:hypothetical protein